MPAAVLNGPLKRARSASFRVLCDCHNRRIYNIVINDEQGETQLFSADVNGSETPDKDDTSTYLAFLKNILRRHSAKQDCRLDRAAT